MKHFIFSTIASLLSIAVFSQGNISLQKLSHYQARVATEDWLLKSPSVKAGVYVNDQRQVVLSNGLVSRTFSIAPNAATVGLRNLVTGEEYIRAVEPEASVTIDGKEYPIGGLGGQINKAYLLPEWLGKMHSLPNAFIVDSFSVSNLKERFASPVKRWATATQWKSAGKELTFYYQNPAVQDVRVEVHYELFDNIPLISKWIAVRNRGNKGIKINGFTGEIIAHHEIENYVATTDKWMRPNLFIENDYSFGGGFTYEESLQSISWEPDSTYTSQSNYALQMPCILKSRPAKGPDVSLEHDGTFESFRTYVMPLDGSDRERNSLSQRKMYRLLAPWSTENPIFLHLTSTDPDVVKAAVDQCVRTGYEMIILSFGSGLNMEDQSPENLERYKQMAVYAHAKGIQIGGYSLLSSRRISDADDVIDIKTGKPGGAMFGNAPCLGSKWGIEYFKKLENFYRQTNFDVLEHDGSYPGDFCASTTHPGHEGYNDSQWKQWKQITDFYQWLRGKDVYLNVPDFYFLSGSNKTSIGYREVNWSLPRDQQVILGRQNIYDGTWTRTPSMCWTFVPLVQYHGGGAAATLEPLSQHLDSYRAHMEQNYGSGVQACYRGNRLYDTDSTRDLVKHEIDHYKKYRDILNADIIHLRRPTGRDWDGILHADPSLKDRGLAMLYNPTGAAMKVTVDLPLYYTGLTKSATISIEDRAPEAVPLDENRRARIAVTIPAHGNTWLVIRDAKK